MVAVASAVIIFIGCGCVFLTPGLTADARGTFSNVISAPLAVAAAVGLFVGAVRHGRRARWSWLLLALGASCWSVAEISRASMYLPVGWRLPAVDDAFYLASLPFEVAAFLVYPVTRWRGADLVRGVIDGLTVALALVFVARGVGLLDWGGGQLRAEVIAAAYPFGDLVVLTLVLSVLMRTGRGRRLPLAFLTVAMASYVVGDSVYAVWDSGSGYVAGTLLDLTWIGSYLTAALAGLTRRTPPEPVAEDTHYGARRLPWILVGGCVAAAATTAVVHAERAASDVAMIVAGVMIAVLLTVRQGWTVRDVTRLNESLGRQVRRTERITESVIDGVVVSDTRGAITFVNHAAAEALGRPPSTLIGTPVVDLVRQDQLDHDAVAEVLLALQAGTVLTEGAAILKRRDGTDLPVELSVGPVEWDDEGAGVVVVFRDVTARRAVERMKNEFMSVISHELRTPLTSIRGALAMLDGGMGGPMQPAGSRMVTLALQSSERLSRLINDILDVERLESGTMRLTLQPHDASRLVENAVHEMSGMAVPAQVRLTIGPVAGQVRADADRVVQTLTNLIGNAIKFSPPGSEVVVTATPRGGGSAAMLEFSVADQGRGIPADKRERIFDRFEQVDSSDARRHGGTGLGLAICRDIVALHGGWIWVSADSEVGADFRFTLPMAADALDPGRTRPATDRPGTDRPGTDRSGSVRADA